MAELHQPGVKDCLFKTLVQNYKSLLGLQVDRGLNHYKVSKGYNEIKLYYKKENPKSVAEY